MKTLTGTLMAFCFVFCLIPQIYKIYKTKSVGDLSKAMIILGALGTIFNLIYNQLNGMYTWSLIKDVLSLFFSFWLLFLCMKYRKH
jgi:uncharacterized protein with PQ loop repeat